MDYSNAIVSGVPLVLVVIGLVEWLKKIGLSGKALTVASLVIGLVFGAAYYHTTTPITDLSSGFAAIVYGLGLGLVASGVYDAARSASRG